jgi:hypothetical protein
MKRRAHILEFGVDKKKKGAAIATPSKVYFLSVGCFSLVLESK